MQRETFIVKTFFTEKSSEREATTSAFYSTGFQNRCLSVAKADLAVGGCSRQNF